MGKAAVGVANLLILCLLSGGLLLAQQTQQFIYPLKPISATVISTPQVLKQTVIKTADYKVIKAKYITLLKPQPDPDMIQITRDEQENMQQQKQANLSAVKRKIIEDSKKIADKFALAEVTFDDLLEVTPSLSQPTTAFNSSPVSQPTAQVDYYNSQTVASAQPAGESGSVSLRRSSGLLQNRSTLEKKYILSYKIHEGEGQ